MRIIVVGCGKIGMTIVSSLVGEGHDVVAVDNDADVIDDVTNIYDAMGVNGNGADCDTLSEAGVDKAELFVAVTDSDEMNMLSCYIARKMGAKHTIARIRNPEYNAQSLGFMCQQLDLSMAINPEMLAARELYNILKMPSAVNIETFSGRNFEMVELRLKPNSPIDGMTLSDVRKKYQAKFLICAVQCNDEMLIPDGDFILKSGDKIALTAAPNEIHKLLKMLGILQKQARSVMILGASKTAYYLAKMLLADGTSVRIIEKNRARCDEICSRLPNVTMICDDGAKQELLLEEGLHSVDAFVALTGMDEENILISIFAASQNVPKVIAKVNRSELAAMAENLGLESIISPQKIISNLLSRYARALNNTLGNNVETLYKLMDGKAEALEFIVSPDFKHQMIKVKDMKFKKNILIAGIIRKRKTIIPSGDDEFMSGDKVIVLATGQQINDLYDIFE